MTDDDIITRVTQQEQRWRSQELGRKQGRAISQLGPHTPKGVIKDLSHLPDLPDGIC